MARVGDIRITKEVCQWKECEECGNPAKYLITFLFEHFRGNPASKAYQRDDCSWASDLDVFSCEDCRRTLSRAPKGYDSGYGLMPLKKLRHIGFYWKQISVLNVSKGDRDNGL